MNNPQVVEPAGAGVALTSEDFHRDVVAGLSRPRKTLPCKYLYDAAGARLFDAICELDEYYLTRAELEILRQYAHEIAPRLGPRANVVDLGSGSGLKARMLLARLDRPASYLPVDVTPTHLRECSTRLAEEYAGLSVRPVWADYTRHFELPKPPPGSGRTTIFFPGSTLGNFEPEEARLFLARMARLCGPAGGLLVGVDLKKSPQVLVPAYNDAQGVTARFNLNLLVRANRELGAGFDLAQFQHQALYNEAAGRIEMHLVSRRSQVVPVDGREFAFAQGESIVTEHSYKYSVREFHQLAARAGLEAAGWWTDERHWFSLHYLRPCQRGSRHAGLAPG